MTRISEVLGESAYWVIELALFLMYADPVDSVPEEEGLRRRRKAAAAAVAAIAGMALAFAFAFALAT